MTESIIDILSQGRDREAQASKIYGVVIGIVTNNKDPDKLGRVKVKFPWLSDDVESWWARLAYPMGGKERGFWWIPEIEDEVLCSFEHGDVRFPYVMGSLYNGKDIPPQADNITSTFAGTGYDHGAYGCSGRDKNEDGKNDLRFIRSRSGHLLIMDDKSGAEKICLADKTGKHRMEIFTDKKKIVVTSADGDIELIADKKVLIRCEELITESRKNTSMDAGGEFLVHAAKDMKHETDKNSTHKTGLSIKIESGTSYEAKAGTSVKIESGAMMTIKSGAPMTVESSVTMTVKASAILTIQGALVKIN